CALDPRPGHPAEPASGGFGPYQAGTKEHENVVGLLEDHLCGKVPAEAAGIADERERHGAPPDRRAPNALLVVGHQPQLGWIAYRLLGRVVPIAHAELVSIAQDEEPRRRLWPRRLARTDPAWWRRYAPHGPRWLWSLAPRDDATTEALRKKIAAKMEIAKLLGALVIAALGWFLSFSLDQSKLAALRGQHAPLWALYAATGLFFAALALYLATMYAYDRLLMPTRFWGDREPVPTHRRPRWLARRPPSSATLVLYQNMVRVWNGLFMPATVAVIGGLLFLAYVVFRGGRAFAGIALLVLIAFFLYYRHAQPRLGTDD
ncbi:MAG TPA: hypothetical protein VFW96_04005, partial [Thermomicrobiales bacterium]|nr:hypothetical protein [Thermomicrobiales bacterium]